MSLSESANLEQTADSLKRNCFAVQIAKNKEMAKELVLALIPHKAVVGIGDSATVRQIGILPDLERRGTRIINAFVPELVTAGKDKFSVFEETIRESLHSDIFLTSANAVTRDGKLVSTDGVGNRVAGMIFGPRKVILIVSRNKIVDDTDKAMHRIRNSVAPIHAATKQKKLPCVATGRCTDCNAPQRICNITVILEKKPQLADISVILVNEDLGLGWEPTWPEDRIAKIRSNYEAVTWASTVLPWQQK